jgi:hypothetical protein
VAGLSAKKTQAAKSETTKGQAGAGDASMRAKQPKSSKVGSLGAPAQATKPETTKRQAGAGDASMRAKQAKSPNVSSLGAPAKHATAK